MKIIITFIISLITFVLLDIIWLGVISKNLYSSEIGHLMSERLNYLAVIAFYLVFITGLVILAIMPGLKETELKRTIINAAVLGFVSYATYDLTNYATLKDWPLRVVLIDISWGTFISTITSIVGFYISSLIK